jgi:hypothetical protein
MVRGGVAVFKPKNKSLYPNKGLGTVAGTSY